MDCGLLKEIHRYEIGEGKEKGLFVIIGEMTVAGDNEVC